ncbi:MAG TPA: hypothetical protein VH475_00085 [Tepidisphaeraceae bacterium]
MSQKRDEYINQCNAKRKSCLNNAAAWGGVEAAFAWVGAIAAPTGAAPILAVLGGAFVGKHWAEKKKECDTNWQTCVDHAPQ